MSNPIFLQTICKSPQWKKWVKYQREKQEFDVAESMECGWLSDKHWQAFLKFAKELKG